jgi:hypothetical protein
LDLPRFAKKEGMIVVGTGAPFLLPRTFIFTLCVLAYWHLAPGGLETRVTEDPEVQLTNEGSLMQ